jgi:hypothetical protein
MCAIFLIMRGFGVLLFCLMAFGQSPKNLAPSKGADHRITVRVPFVGCASDGQTGPIDAPSGETVAVLAMQDEAANLAYYKAENGIGILAPRGWHCFGTYGSGGDQLYVKPQPIDTAGIFHDGPGFADGPGIEVAYRFGGTSGRFSVAEIIARVFPAYLSFAREVAKEPGTRPFKFGPYPKDELAYRGKALVEYRTPPNTEGLGTQSWLKKGSEPIEGAAMILEGDTDLAILSVRMPTGLSGLTTTLIRQFEQDASR